MQCANWTTDTNYRSCIYFLGERPDVHKDVLLGVASVDLFLLTTGFRQIHGWYNLVDFSGQKVGQIKVNGFSLTFFYVNCYCYQKFHSTSNEHLAETFQLGSLCNVFFLNH